MWSSVLVLALVTVLDPPRLLAVFLVTSRPRPGKNLLFYYLGCLVLNFWFLLVPLAVLYFVPTLGTLLQRYAAPPAADSGSTLQPIPLALGVLSLLIAARLAMRLRVRRKTSDASPLDADSATNGESPTEATKPNPISTAISRLSTVEEGSQGLAAAIRRSVGRVYGAWKEGSVWISLFMGLTYSPLQATAALAVIATSGAPILAQLSAAVSFVAIMLAVVELILLGYLISHAKTEAVLRSAHGWTEVHNLEVFATISAVGGVFLVATGLGVF
ncbi:MAG TPA: GAP family protein [Mycobacterium sp.]|nr:GAP family protein [Mycobacterium sp.]